jgi:hypothetical protein
MGPRVRVWCDLLNILQRMNTRTEDLRNLSAHILLNADYVEEESNSKYSVLHVEAHLYEKFLRILESLTQ